MKKILENCFQIQFTIKNFHENSQQNNCEPLRSEVENIMTKNGYERPFYLIAYNENEKFLPVYELMACNLYFNLK